MSTIRVDNVQPSAGGTAFNLIDAALKAYRIVDGSGAVGAGGFNFSSITDNGVGDYNHGFTNNMADANYIMTAGGYVNPGVNAYEIIWLEAPSTSAFDTRVGLGNGSATGNGTLVDGDRITFMIAGDLA